MVAWFHNPLRRGTRHWSLLSLMLSVLWLGGAGIAQGQTTTTLSVQLRDTADEPVAGAAVRVIDARSLALISSGHTDAHGLATFPGMPTSPVRVTIAGTLPNGTPLVLVGQDAAGIWATLPARQWLMDLRVDTDGTVFPDMGLSGAGAADGDDHAAIAGGTFANAAPTASSPAGAAPHAHPAAPVAARPTAAEPQSSPRQDYAVTLALLMFFGTATCAVIVLGRRIS